MAKKNHNRILSKMLAAFVANDAAAPEDIEEAVDAIEDITTEEPAEPPVEPEAQDAEPGEDPIAEIMRRLDALEAAVGGKAQDAEEPEAPVDPLDQLENDLDEIEAAEGAEVEEPMQPEEDASEPEAHYVDPEEINEQDEDEVVVEEEEEEEPMPVGDCGSGKKACDAVRAAIKAVRPVIAQLPPSERKKAADAAVAALRKEHGIPTKSEKNSYLALKAAKRKAADSKTDVGSLGRKIMAARNVNYTK